MYSESQTKLGATFRPCFYFPDLVLQLLSSTDENAKREAQITLDNGVDEIKDIAINFKKQLKPENASDQSP